MSRPARRPIVLTILITLGLVLAAVIAWFRIPYSPLKREFSNTVEDARTAAAQRADQQVYSAADFAHLPPIVQSFVANSGYLGKPRESYFVAEFEDVTLRQGVDARELIVDYQQYNFGGSPARYAFIDSGLFGVPFQGFDCFDVSGASMHGVLGKAVTLFDDTSAEVEASSLVTYLGEAMFLPSVLADDQIDFEVVADNQVRGTISAYGHTVSGIFSFNADAELTEFTTEDRWLSGADGSPERVAWSARLGDYVTSPAGIRHPSTFQAIWHLPEQDLVYFDGTFSRFAHA